MGRRRQRESGPEETGGASVAMLDLVTNFIGATILLIITVRPIGSVWDIREVNLGSLTTRIKALYSRDNYESRLVRSDFSNDIITGSVGQSPPTPVMTRTQDRSIESIPWIQRSRVVDVYIEVTSDPATTNWMSEKLKLVLSRRGIGTVRWHAFNPGIDHAADPPQIDPLVTEHDRLDMDYMTTDVIDLLKDPARGDSLSACRNEAARSLQDYATDSEPDIYVVATPAGADDVISEMKKHALRTGHPWTLVLQYRSPTTNPDHLQQQLSDPEIRARFDWRVGG